MEKREEVKKERVKKTSIDLPLIVWKAIGHLAVEQERNFSDITSEALSLYLWLNQELGGFCSGRPLSEVAREMVSEHLKEVRRNEE
jgi:hypothetical protein